MIDRKTRKLLAYISKHENITDDQIKERFHSEILEEIDVLEKNKCISTTVTDFIPPGIYKCSYSITPEGRAFLEEGRNSRLLKIITAAISAGLLLVAILNRYDN